MIVLTRALWFGLEATSLRRWTLARHGFALVDVVEGRTLDEAERRYFARDGRGAPPAPLAAARRRGSSASSRRAGAR